MSNEATIALVVLVFVILRMISWFYKSRDFYVVIRFYYNREDNGKPSSEKPDNLYTAIFDDFGAAKLYFDTQEQMLGFSGARRDEQINRLYSIYAPSRRLVEKRARKITFIAYNHLLCETPIGKVFELRREFKELIEIMAVRIEPT